MIPALRPSTLALFIGDIFCFAAALWLSLYLRSFEIPSTRIIEGYAYAIIPLFALWVGVYFIAGLYERRRLILARRDFSATLLSAQVVNVIIAALFFFFVPVFIVAPKTVLVIYLVVSFLLVLGWRTFLYPWLGLQRAEAAIVLGEGKEIDELCAALESASRAPVRVIARIRPGPAAAREVAQTLERSRPSFIIADLGGRELSSAFPDLYNLLTRGIRFIDAPILYEELFGRIPLPHIDDRWLARNVSRSSHALYDPLKRAMDIAVALPAALLSLIFYPFVVLALKLQDGGPVIISMPRVGEGGEVIAMHKFRSMTGNDSGNWGAQGTQLQVTPVGKFLRVSRLDELPQLWDVVMGTFSLIGPRPEFPAAVAQYEKTIPHYGVRHLIKPGLSGWAQIYGEHAHHGVDLDTTKNKLSYDLYYVKHRSLVLDLVIALKTVKKLLTRSGV